MEARFVINDGQHRRAAIQMALEENPAVLGLGERPGLGLLLPELLVADHLDTIELRQYAARLQHAANLPLGATGRPALDLLPQPGSGRCR